VTEVTTTPAPGSPGDASWRDRAVERSLRSAREKAVSRSDRFLRTATELLSETGRTDFTVQELVERSKTSLRSFYQHFGSKDELLLALFEEVIRFSTDQWRVELESYGSGVDKLQYLVTAVHDQATDTSMGGISRALSAYHLQLAESKPLEYARVLQPMRDLILELVNGGVEQGAFRSDIDAETLAMVMMQALVGAATMHALGVELTGEPLASARLWAFCLGGLTGPPVVTVARTPVKVNRKR
jgi:AcrR family transcriptional regulator